MTTHLTLFAIAALTLGIAPAATRAGAPADQGLALIHVQVIDVVTGRVARDRTVVMRNARIVAIDGSARPLPAGVMVVEGRGDYVLPGLWDSHVHLSDTSIGDTAGAVAPAFLQAGVTTVRDMGGNLGAVDTIRRLIATRAIEGPHILRAGPFLDGPKEGAPDRLTVETREQGFAAAQALHAEGVDFLKIHNGISREAFQGVLSAARVLHMRVAAHLPHSVSAEEAVDAGVNTLEHTETLLESGLRALNLPGRTPDEGQLALNKVSSIGPGSLIMRMKAKGACFTPTLSEYRNFSGLSAQTYPLDAAKIAPPTLTAFWDKYFPPEPQPEAARKNAIRQTIFRAFFGVVRAMDQAGIPIMAGTDFGARDIYPGYSLHEELGLLSKAGLSNLHVLQAATINPAKCMGLASERGTLEPGKAADLVVIEGNPLQDLSALGRLRFVVANGRLITRQDPVTLQ